MKHSAKQQLLSLPMLTTKSQGMTLIELLVAMTLGLFLVGIVATVFVSTKASFQTTSQLSVVQENTRFATTFLQRDIRMAGYTECGNNTKINDLLASPISGGESGIYGWEFSGTKIGNTYSLTYDDVEPSDDIPAARSSNTSTASNWKSSGSTDLSAIIHAFEPLRGSDIILLVNDEKVDLTLVGANNTTTNSLNTTEQVSGIVSPGQIIKVGDCSIQDQFQLIASNGSTLSGGAGGGNSWTPGNKNGADFTWSKAWQPEANIYSQSSSVYYIGTGASGVPSLFRLASNCNLSVSACSTFSDQASELVEGVENMQVLYGEDTDATPDFIANIYRSADQVIDFDKVVSVRIGLLMRSPSNAVDQVDTKNYTLADSVTIDVPNKRFMRFTSNQTVHLRNKGI